MYDSRGLTSHSPNDTSAWWVFFHIGSTSNGALRDKSTGKPTRICPWNHILGKIRFHMFHSTNPSMWEYPITQYYSYYKISHYKIAIIPLIIKYPSDHKISHYPIRNYPIDYNISHYKSPSIPWLHDCFIYEPGSWDPTGPMNGPQWTAPHQWGPGLSVTLPGSTGSEACHEKGDSSRSTELNCNLCIV